MDGVAQYVFPFPANADVVSLKLKNRSVSAIYSFFAHADSHVPVCSVISPIVGTRICVLSDPRSLSLQEHG